MGVALCAMMSNIVDEKNSDQKLHKGSKLKLAESVSRVFSKVNDDRTMVSHLTLLTPSWFSYLVSRDIFMKRNNISRLDTLSDMVSAKESSNNKSVCDVVIYKYFSMSSIHVALRAHQFFNSTTLRTSSKFCTYNLTKLNSNEKRRSSVVMKNLMKFDVEKLADDLSCLLQISNGSTNVGCEESLLFVMTSDRDKAWCL